MGTNRLFILMETIECAVPDESVIKCYRDDLARQFKALELDPHIFSNGSAPKEVHISSNLTPGREIRIAFYQMRGFANTLQILSFLEEHNAIHLGALGLMLIGKLLPQGIFFIGFEEGDPYRASALRHNFDGTFQFMVLKRDASWDPTDGFVCVTPC
jgi:hypothetical protein